MVHDGSHIGTTCETCGTHHRVLESIPNQPLTRSQLKALEETEQITFAKGVTWMFGSTSRSDTETTEEIVLATQSDVYLLSLYEPGWVIDQEIDPKDDEDVEDVAMEVWVDASQSMATAMEDIMR